MKLYLQRHCQPVLGMPMDSARELTPEGKRQAEECAAFMMRHVGRVDIVITSPFVRAMQTAEVMAKALGSHVASSRMLQPDGKPEEMWAEIERLAPLCKDVLVVGHDPSINELLLWLLIGGPESPIVSYGNANAMFRFEHGAIAHLKGIGEADCTLHWFVDVPIIERDQLPAEVIEAVADLAEHLTEQLNPIPQSV